MQQAHQLKLCVTGHTGCSKGQEDIGHFESIGETLVGGNLFTKKASQKEIINDIKVIIGEVWSIWKEKKCKDGETIESSRRQRETESTYSTDEMSCSINLGQSNINAKYLEAEKLWNEIIATYEGHDLDTTKILIKQYEELSMPISPKQAAQFYAIKQYYYKLVYFASYCDYDGWIFDKEENGVRLSYKTFPNEKTIAVKIYGDIDIEILPFLAIICYIDLMQEYVPFVYDSKQIKQLSRNSKAGYTKTYIPLLNDRESYFCAVGYDRMKTNGTIFFYTHTYDNDANFQLQHSLKVPDDPELVRLHCFYFILYYRPLSRTKARIRLASKVDLRMEFLPMFIVQKSARYFAYKYFYNMMQSAKKYRGSKWYQNVLSRPDMYEFFQRKIDEYFQRSK